MNRALLVAATLAFMAAPEPAHAQLEANLFKAVPLFEGEKDGAAFSADELRLGGRLALRIDRLLIEGSAATILSDATADRSAGTAVGLTTDDRFFSFLTYLGYADAGVEGDEAHRHGAYGVAVRTVAFGDGYVEARGGRQHTCDHPDDISWSVEMRLALF